MTHHYKKLIQITLIISTIMITTVTLNYYQFTKTNAYFQPNNNHNVPTSGIIWNHNVIKVYVNPRLTINKNYDNGITNSMLNWDFEPHNPICFIQTYNKNKADVIIIPKILNKKTVKNDTYILGSTSVSKQIKNNYYQQMCISLDMHAINELYKTNYDTNNPASHESNFISAVVEHELGHAIGLDHSTYKNSIMQAEGTHSISNTDIQAVRFLYMH